MTSLQVEPTDLYNGKVTDHFVEMEELSSKPRVSPEGANSLGISKVDLKGKTIAQLEVLMNEKGYKLISVGFDKIYFKEI